MRSVESDDEHVRKFSFAPHRLLQTPSIGFARQDKMAFFQQLVEMLNDRCKRRQREFFEFPSGSFQAIQGAQQRRRRTSNGFGGKRFGFVRPILHFARGDC